MIVVGRKEGLTSDSQRPGRTLRACSPGEWWARSEHAREERQWDTMTERAQDGGRNSATVATNIDIRSIRNSSALSIVNLGI